MSKGIWVLAAGIVGVAASGCAAPWNVAERSSATTSPTTTGAPQAPVVPSPATTQPAVSLPTVDSAPSGAYTPAVKPATLYLSGDSGNIVDNLHWVGWDSHGATGYGIVDVEGCVPDCASGSQTPTTVTIYLNKPVNGAFSLLTEKVKGQPVQNVSLRTSAGQASPRPPAAPTTAPPLPKVDTSPGGRFTPAVKPATLYLSGDSGNIVDNLHWAGWDSHGATGYGIVDVEGCVPDCAQGSQTPTPVTIYLNKPVNGVFTLLTEEIKGQPAQNITLPSS